MRITYKTTDSPYKLWDLVFAKTPVHTLVIESGYRDPVWYAIALLKGIQVLQLNCEIPDIVDALAINPIPKIILNYTKQCLTPIEEGYTYVQECILADGRVVVPKNRYKSDPDIFNFSLPRRTPPPPVRDHCEALVYTARVVCNLPRGACLTDGHLQ